MMHSNKFAIGISIGTTDSCVAIWTNEQAEVLSDQEGSKTMKSYVAFTDSGCIIGNEAYNQALQNPKNTIYDIKMLIGKNYVQLATQKSLRNWPFEIEPDFRGRPLIVVTQNNKSLKLYPEQIYAMIIVQLRKIAESHLGYAVTDAVLSIPATFNHSQREAAKHAATIAGLNPLRLIKEPIAALIASDISRKEKNFTDIAIINIGRTQTEICMVTRDEDVFEVISINNCLDLNSEIIDRILVDHCMEQFKPATGHDVQNVPKAIKRINKACEKAKISLSSSQQTTIEIDSLYQDEDFSYTLTRTKFEELCAHAFSQIISPLNDSLTFCKKAKYRSNLNIQKVLLLGGPAQTPKMIDTVSLCFQGIKPEVLKNSRESIASGAALYASFLSKSGSALLQEFLLVDAAGLSLGIKAAGGKMANIIPRSHLFPCKINQIFTTFSDNQTAVTIEIYEGEASVVQSNHFVGKVILDGINPAPKGEPQIQVTFTLDNHGILAVEAFEQTGGANKINAKFEKEGFAPAEINQLASYNTEILNSSSL